MGLEQLSKSILDKANREADVIVKAAFKEAEDNKRKLELEMEEAEKKSDISVKKTIEQIENKETASASLQAKKESLLVKKQVINEVFDKVETNIDKLLTKAQRKKLIEGLVKQAKSEIKIGKIFCNKADSAYVSGKTEYMDMLGGIIAEDKSGEVMVDYSFESLLEDVKEEKIAEVTKVLFEND